MHIMCAFEKLPDAQWECQMYKTVPTFPGDLKTQHRLDKHLASTVAQFKPTRITLLSCQNSSKKAIHRG